MVKCIDCDCRHKTVRRQWNALTCQYENVSKYYCWGVPEPFEIKDVNKECTEYPEKRGGDMPIVEKDGDVCLEYHIPEHIKSAIPEDFYLVFLGFLIGSYGKVPVECDIGEYLCYAGGTGGWHKALKRACVVLDLPWLHEYYHGLEWYDSDLFDGEIADEIERRIP